MKKLIASVMAGAAFVSLVAPVAAQDADFDDAEMAKVMEAMQDAFVAESLTAEQEARLPQATMAVAKVVPEGTYARMMRDVMGGMMDKMLTGFVGDTIPPYELSTYLGVELEAIESLDADALALISSTIDPNYAERTRMSISAMTEAMADLYGDLEPAIREGLSRAYAVRFSDAQLADINAFFATDSGAAYANESMMIFADPQTMSGMMQAMPMVMERMPKIMAGMKDASAGLPDARNFDDLSAQQRGSIAKALSVTVPELRNSMAAAALERDAADDTMGDDADDLTDEPATEPME